MIGAALLAGIACGAIFLWDAARFPSSSNLVMRGHTLAAWGVVWLACGINLAGFPKPSVRSFVLLCIACIGAAMIAPGVAMDDIRSRSRAAARRVHDGYLVILLAISAGLLLVHLFHIAASVRQQGLASAFIALRVSRTGKEGVFGIPGFEAWHAVAFAGGVLGYALWVAEKRAVGAWLAVLGLSTAILSTGRWEPIIFAFWCAMSENLLRPIRPRRRVVASLLGLYLLLGLFFACHGVLTRKVESVGSLLDLPAEQRLAEANAGRSLGLDSEAFSGYGKLRGGGQAGPAMPRGADAAAAANPWLKARPNIQDRLKRLNPMTRMMVLYLSGPTAAFDYAERAGILSQRPVLFYVPLKVARILGLWPGFRYPAVDPFLDIGVPFNNFTVLFSFVSELGEIGGPAGWLLIALLLRMVNREILIRGEGAVAVVAAGATAVIAVQAPWGNTFFGGSLFVWFAVLVGARLATRTRPVNSLREPSCAA